MDEIEWKQMYNDAVTAAQTQPGPEMQRALLLILQLLNAHEQRILEIQDDMEDLT